jgi:acyl carrier protein
MSGNQTSDVDIEDLRALLAEELELPVEEVTDDANLATDLEVDSLSAMEIAVLLEKKYKIKISEDEIKSLTSLQVIHKLVAAKVDAA